MEKPAEEKYAVELNMLKKLEGISDPKSRLSLLIDEKNAFAYSYRESLSKVLNEPLSESTRRKRKALLLFNFIGLSIALTGIFPKNITSLGIDLQQVGNTTLLFLLVGIIAYFFIGFIIYAFSDFLRWFEGNTELNMNRNNYDRIGNMLKEEYDGYKELHIEALKNWDQISIDNYNRFINSIESETNIKLRWPNVSIIRAVFEFLLPALFSLVILTLLFVFMI